MRGEIVLGGRCGGKVARRLCKRRLVGGLCVSATVVLLCNVR